MARSLRSRIALALGLTAALSLAASAVISFGLVRGFTESRARADLGRVAAAVAASGGDLDEVEGARVQLLRRVVGVSGNLLAVVGPLGGVRGTAEARAVAETIDTRALIAGRSSSGTVEVGGERYVYVALPVQPPRDGAPRRLADAAAGVVLARPVGLARDAWGPILARVLLAAGVAAALAALASTLLARRLARPVQRVAAATAAVAGGDLSQRVPVEGPDELAGLARSFNAMSEALAEARRREAEFLSSISHELRTPLTAIRGYVDALDEGAVRDDAGRAEALQVIRTEAARLERLVGDVMDLARLDAQEFRLDVRDADLATVVGEAALAHAAAARDAGLELATDALGPLPCRTDPDRVRQVLSNLVENAIRVTPAGGTVRLVARAGAGGVTVEVSDTGPGIPPEHLPHVFERAYVRTVASRAPAGAGEPSALAPGRGLGLAIVRELVRALGGRIDVASEPDRGTTFRVTLPPR